MYAPNKPGLGARFNTLKTSSSVVRNKERMHGARPARQPLAMRRYHIKALLETGSIKQSEHIGPALPAFEAAFSAFAHGTLICTPQGQIAIEDLEPGMRVQTAGHGDQEIMWVGSMTLMPRSSDLPQGGSLTRIVADSFGLGRPERDLLVGPGARVVQRSLGIDITLVPASVLVDGQHAVEVVPPRPVTVYHICLREHAVINAGGLESESYHPGNGLEISMSAQLLDLFLSFFPHIGTLADFGTLAHPRQSLLSPVPEVA